MTSATRTPPRSAPARRRSASAWSPDEVAGVEVLARAREDGGRDVLPRAPLLARGTRPSLSVLLRALPDPASPSVADLVDSGALALTVDLDPFAGEPPPAGVQPVFATAVRVRLVRGDRELSSSDGAGPRAVVALAAALGADDVRATVPQLAGARPPDPLVVRVEVDAPGPPKRHDLAVRLDLAELADALRDVQRPLTEADLVARLPVLLAGGIAAELDGAALEPAGVDPALAAEVLRLVLPLARPVLARGPDGAYVPVTSRPPSGSLEAHRRVTVATSGTVVLEAPLADLLGPAPDVALLAPPRPGAAAVPVPRRVRARGAAPVALPLLAGERTARALPLVLTPDRARRPTPVELLGVDRRHVFGDAVALDDLVVALPDDGAEPVLSLPVVTDPPTPLCADRTDSALRWWVPEPVLVAPAPGDDPATGPYAFDVVRTGLTTGTGGAARGLLARLRLTVRPGQSAAVAAALAELGGAVRGQAVATDPPSVALEVPFRVQGQPEVSRQQFPADVEVAPDGTITARVELLDDWARLAYEALAAAGPAAGPARLVVTTAYRAYVATPSSGVVVVGGDRRCSLVPEQVTAWPPEGRLSSVALPGMRLRLETVRGSWPVRPVQVLVRPELEDAVLQQAVLEKVRRTTYALRTLVVQTAVEVQVPCATHGGLYRQDDGDGPRPVGCVDALRLGEAPARRWREVAPAPLADAPALRVLASLQQPGLFCVVPPQWRVVRYGPDEPGGRAYRPVLQLYDVADETGRTYHLATALAPDLPDWQRRDLLDALRPLVPAGSEPRLVLPTDPAVEGELATTWALPAGIEASPVVALGDAVRATFSARGTEGGALLVGLLDTGGLAGQLAVTLPDGTRTSSALLVDRSPVGPTRGGPVEVAVEDGKVVLTDRIAQPVDVTALVVRAPGQPARRVPVGQRLEPGARLEVDPGGPGEVLAVAREAGPPPPVAELGLFADDVTVELGVLVVADTAARGLRGLQVDARVEATGEQHGAELATGGSVTLGFTLPLTGYLSPAGLAVRVSTRPADPTVAPVEGPWRPWDLARQGSVVTVDPSYVP